jgi:hypothetical protein
MIPLIKLSKKENNKSDLIKSFLYVYCYMNNISLSDTEFTILSYYILYGLKDETIELIFNSKITNESTFKNIMSKLRKNNFINRVNKTDFLNDKFKLTTDGTIAMLLKLHVK